jgi:hypothetical protein
MASVPLAEGDLGCLPRQELPKTRKTQPFRKAQGRVKQAAIASQSLRVFALGADFNTDGEMASCLSDLHIVS